MTKDKALRLALEYVELVPDDRYNADHIDRDALITAIKAALANEALERKAENARELGLDYEPLEAKDEPVVNTDHVICPNCVHQFRAIPQNVQKLMLASGFEPPFTTPPQRTWVGLTIDEREQIQQECFGKVPHHVAFAHAIEAKLKEKNT